MRILIILLLSIFSTSVLQAQVKDSISHTLKEVEVAANLRPSTSQSSTPLQVLTERDILKQGIQSVADAVKRFNGVVLKDYGGVGGLKTVSIRGMGAEYTTVSYDGMVVSNSQSGQVDIGRFTLDNISTLSLSIGQDDNIFISAKSYATAGVLNLQTKRPEFTNRRYNLHTKITSGSFGYFEPMIDYAYRLSNKSAITANINWQRADGRYPFKYERDVTLPNRKRRNSDTDILRSEINLYNKLSSKDNLDIKLYFFDSERGLPGAVIDMDSKEDENERLWDKNAFAQLAYNRKLNENWKLKSIAKYDYNYQKYKTEPYTNSGARTNQYNKYYQHEVYWSNTALYQILPTLSVSLSEDLTYNSLRSSFTAFNKSRSEPDRYSSYTALAAHYKVSKLVVTASGLYSYIHESIKDKEDANTNYSRLSPSISASIKPLNSTDLRIRASYKHIFRIPTFMELYYQATGRSLDPESSSQYNVGATWIGQINNSPIQYINISIDGYYNDVKDKIVVIPTPFLPTVMNQGKVEMKGLDTKLSTNIYLSKDINVDISGVYSYLRASDADKKSESYKGQLAYTPKHSGSFTFTLNNPWVTFNYTLLASSLRYSRTQNLEDQKVKGYTDHSISIFKEMEIKKYKLYANASLLNMLNKNYSVIAFYPMPRRSFKVTVGCKF